MKKTKFDRIPAKQAEFFFDKNRVKEPPHKLLVVDRRSRFKDGKVGRDHMINDYKEYPASLGAHCEGWMANGDPFHTPEGVFASRWLDRVQERSAIKEALREFGKIEECGWARTMYYVLEKLDDDK